MDQRLSKHCPSFIGASRSFIDGSICLFGVPYDATTSYRPGTRFGPDALRSASEGLEFYSPILDRDLEDSVYCDIGNLEFSVDGDQVLANIYKVARDIVEGSSKPLMLGGEHSISPPAVRAVYEQYPNLLLIQLDAHADLRESFNNHRNSHACAMRRCLDFLPAEQLIQFGIRSGTNGEFAEMRAANRLVQTPEALAELLKAHTHRPVYLTIDLDVFDPSLMPGTGTPEAGGIDWKCFERILDTLSGFRMLGADVVELAPTLDPSNCSAALASKLVREMILFMR